MFINIIFQPSVNSEVESFLEFVFNNFAEKKIELKLLESLDELQKKL